MAYKVDLDTHTDNRGNLTVIENILPFIIKRVFYIYGVDTSVRGGHRHHKTIQAAVCIQGECKIFSNNGIKKEEFHLNKPSKCIILLPEDWHYMFDFSKNAILMVLASENFDEKDYIFEKYD
ncbi:MAG: FdtA/QdtA family cupin domain-containing protein [Bacteroidales bacterium]